MTISKRWTIALSIIAGAFVLYCAIFAFALHWVHKNGRQAVFNLLRKNFHGEAQLDSLNIKVYPYVEITGSGLKVFFRGRQDLPPLIAIDSFTAHASWAALMRYPHHISHLDLVGLQITVPTGIPRDPNAPKQPSRFRGAFKHFRGIYIDDIEAPNATLTIVPKQPWKDPKVYNIETFKGHTTNADGRIKFHAILQNPVPPGDIVSDGSFGAWDADVPGDTPVSGSFTYQNADLGYFKGISGILSAEGNYGGVLQTITVDGTTETPDFTVATGGHQVDLQTKFHAIVDGENGDTTLDPVDAHFRNTSIQTAGSVAGTPGRKGKTVSLDARTTNEGRIEDLLWLAVPDNPAITGDCHLAVKMVIPGGSKLDVIHKLNLDGVFSIGQMLFTSQGIEHRVGTLSARSQGDTSPVSSDERVASEVRGKFRLRDGVITFSDLHFNVPGAQVSLVGTYGLDHQSFDMHGVFDMDVKLSQTTTGVKSFLLRAVNPLFAKPGGGGSRIPFKISGTEKFPIYSLDFHRRKEDDAEFPVQNPSAPSPTKATQADPAPAAKPTPASPPSH